MTEAEQQPKTKLRRVVVLLQNDLEPYKDHINKAVTTVSFMSPFLPSWQWPRPNLSNRSPDVKKVALKLTPYSQEWLGRLAEYNSWDLRRTVNELLYRVKIGQLRFLTDDQDHFDDQRRAYEKR